MALTKLEQIRLLRQLKCGEFSFMCCLSEDDLLRLVDLVKTAPLSEVQAIHRGACCNVTPRPAPPRFPGLPPGFPPPVVPGPGEPGVPGIPGLPLPPPPPVDNGNPEVNSPCVGKLLDKLCAAPVQAALAVAAGWIRDRLKEGPQLGKERLYEMMMLLLVAINGLVVACAARKMTRRDLELTCIVINQADTILNIMSGAMGALSFVIKQLFDLLGANDIKNLATECCNAPASYGSQADQLRQLIALLSGGQP